MEEVVLVDDQNNVVGTAEKDTVHTHTTPLHRGFSLFLFNSHKQLLVTRRALSKKTFPGVWTNTVCGHPGQGETAADAAVRRLKAELGIAVTSVKEMLPYKYRFADQNGIVENEICPVLVVYADQDPAPDPDEVMEWKWVDWEGFLKNIDRDPAGYSPWCREEAKLLNGRV